METQDAPDRLHSTTALTRLVMQVFVGSSVVARRLDLTVTDLQVLATLWLDGPSDLSDVGERAGVSRSGMTGLVRRLERAGLIVRTPHPFDGRRSSIALADDASAPILDAVRQIECEHVRLVDDMTPSDVRTVLDFAARSTAIFAAIAGEYAPGGARTS